MVEQGAGPTSVPAEVPPGRFSRLTQATEAFPTAGDHLFFANREIDRVDVDDLRLDRCVFFNFGLKQATFRRGHLSHCFFERTYLRHATFTGVDLTGTFFIGCNLKYASFDGCRLDYVSFEECQLDYDNILQNLPAQPNLKRHLLRSLRLNASKRADPEESDLLRRELKAERDELWATFTGANEYFRSRPGRERWQAFGKWCGHQPQRLLWGYGLQLRALMVTAASIILLGAVLAHGNNLLFHVGTEAAARSLGFREALFVSTTSFTTVGAGDIIPVTDWGKALVAAESLSGAAFLGLLAATAYRKIAR